MWCFDIAHLPGSTNIAADAASRHSATSEFFPTIPGAERDSPDFLEEVLLASVRQNTLDKLTLNREEIAWHTANDAALNDLLSAIPSDFDVNFPQKERYSCQYLPHRDGFYISDDVILYNDCSCSYSAATPLSSITRITCRPSRSVGHGTTRAQPFSARG